jgi:hypothetical protein
MSVRTVIAGMSVVLCATGALAQDAPSVKVGARVNDFLIRRAYVYPNGTLPAQHVSFFAHLAGAARTTSCAVTT